MISLLEHNGHAKPDKVVWNKKKFGLFKRAYKKALNGKVHTFKFDQHEFSTSYAGYLVEYLEGQFP